MSAVNEDRPELGQALNEDRRPRTRLRIRWGAVAAQLLLGALLGALAVWALEVATDPAGGLPPCPTEDSNGCYWDGDTRGNKTGLSFVVDEHGNVTYLP